VVGKPLSYIKPGASRSLRTTEIFRYVWPSIIAVVYLCTAADAADTDIMEPDMDSDVDAGINADTDANVDANADADADVDADANSELDDAPASSSQAYCRDVGGGRGGSLLSLLAAAVVVSVSC
jgi:hypothetical protein